MNNQNIKCDVVNCKYNSNKKTCTLNEIKVSTSKGKLQTICTNYKEGE